VRKKPTGFLEELHELKIVKSECLKE